MESSKIGKRVYVYHYDTLGNWSVIASTMGKVFKLKNYFIDTGLVVGEVRGRFWLYYRGRIKKVGPLVAFVD